MFRKISFAAACVVLMASPAFAKKPVEKVVVADSAPKFEILVEKIHSQMVDGGRYEFMSVRDREAVDLSLQKMSAMLTGSGSVDAMSSEDKDRLFNEQEKVNGLLARNSDDRLVCQDVAPVGSHLPVRTCKTYRQIAKDRSDSRRDMQNMTNGRIGSGPGN